MYFFRIDPTSPFLDTLIVRKPDGSVKLLVYRKATHTDQYLNFSSHHPIHHKLGVVRTSLDRSNSVVTEAKDRERKESNWLSNAVAILNGLSSKLNRKWIISRLRSLPRRKKNLRKAIPYVESLTGKATRIYRRHGISTAVRPHTTLKKMLVHQKDKRDPLTTTDCVYEIPMR